MTPVRDRLRAKLAAKKEQRLGHRPNPSQLPADQRQLMEFLERFQHLSPEAQAEAVQDFVSQDSKAFQCFQRLSKQYAHLLPSMPDLGGSS